MLPFSGVLVMGPPTPRMLAKLSYVKWCVLATYACAVGRVTAGDAIGALNDVFGGLFGTFLLREDPMLQGCYRCLHESPLGIMSEGGMACLLPYTFMAGLNGLFSALRVYTILNKFGTLMPCNQEVGCFLPMWLSFSAVAQLAAVFLCWNVYKQMQQQAFSGIYMQPEAQLQGPPQGGRVEGEAPTQPGEPGVGVSMNPFMRSQFTPFQGTAHYLAPELLECEEGI